jgi:opacity protein-like surface antigen
MRAILTILLVLALPVCAGTPAKQTIAPCAPPSLVSWFSGASIGYLTGSEEPMYNLHVGVSNSCWALGGWNIAIFGEVGYIQKNEGYLEQRPGGSLNVGYELLFLPLTCNVKFERELADSLNIYCGAGVGAAWTQIELNIHGRKLSDSDWVLATQVFGGVNFNVTPNIDIYGGARWIHSSLGNDCLLEIGTRYKF